ncbi:unnamed protein product [Caenorhabditis bovis]|uniref:Uncharacterized protein n=1 Tax=Caenorhabditis bovis TaxID=2654633 RepID=A0A8S1F6M5_9PELO|nr:unnamed protein product [Caenorhabditis bovis]
MYRHWCKGILPEVAQIVKNYHEELENLTDINFRNEQFLEYAAKFNELFQWIRRTLGKCRNSTVHTHDIEDIVPQLRGYLILAKTAIQFPTRILDNEGRIVDLQLNVSDCRNFWKSVFAALRPFVLQREIYVSINRAFNDWRLYAQNLEEVVRLPGINDLHIEIVDNDESNEEDEHDEDEEEEESEGGELEDTEAIEERVDTVEDSEVGNDYKH